MGIHDNSYVSLLNHLYELEQEEQKERRREFYREYPELLTPSIRRSLFPTSEELEEEARLEQREKIKFNAVMSAIIGIVIAWLVWSKF